MEKSFLLLPICFIVSSCAFFGDNQSEENDSQMPNSHINNYYSPILINTNTSTGSAYEYNYDVSGYDDAGNYVSGNIDVDEYGVSGYIEDEDGNEIDVDVEWIGNGELEATDESGNSYDLEVE